MSRPWVAIQRNPSSGSGSKRAEIIAMCSRLRRLGVRPRVYTARDKLGLRLSTPDGREGLVCLVAAGGDGTIGDLVNRFPGLPLAILPLGTENLLAKYLQVPCDGEFVADLIGAGHCRRLDAGLLNGRRFVLMVTAGFDAEVVRRTHDRRRGNIRKWNYVQPILESLRTYGYPELRLELDGAAAASRPLAGRLAVVANVPAYAMGLPLAADADSQDGLLDLRLFERPSAFQMMRYLYNVARRKHEQLPDVRVGRVRQVLIRSDVPVPVQCDGDPAGWTPADISIVPGALTLLAPGPAAAAT
jgi:diacylglycerol kinase family enzyme